MSNIRDFIPMSKLGEGAYSTVYKVQRRSDNLIYALKKVKMNQLNKKQQENALNEIRILASIQSPAIVSYKEAFFDQSINVLCIVMQFADGGDLHNLVNQYKKQREAFPQQQIWNAVKNMLLGLQTLHSRTIMHRDLKSANVFKTKQGYKLGDLNVSKVVTGSLAYTQTGTPYYASPEVWRDEPYDCKSDIWSLGCIVFEMAALKPPFDGKDLEELFKNVQNKAIPTVPRQYSSDLTDLIHYCLNKKATKRPTASQLLNHPPFQKYFNTNNNCSKQLVSKQSSQIKQQLLQTIKLPADLKKLKDKLPESKYQSQKMENKSAVIQSQIQRGNSSQRTPVGLERNINKSEMFKGPPSKITKQEDSIKISRTPVSEVKLNPKISDIVAKYSDRIHHSDRKSNKVQRASSNRNYQQGYLNIEKYFRDDVPKRPSSQNQNSIPRTEKVQPRMVALKNYNVQMDIEEMRKRLVKKTRVVSNNHPRPNWWG